MVAIPASSNCDVHRCQNQVKAAEFWLIILFYDNLATVCQTQASFSFHLFIFIKYIM